MRAFLLLAIGMAAVSPCYPATQTDGSASAASASSTPAPAFADKLKRPGLPNLGRVTESLFRGGQPRSQGYNQLHSMGIGVVVNLNTSKKDVALERTEMESRGIRYVSIPWSPVSLPTDAQVAEFLRLIRGNPDKKIFVHCQRGADSTGVMVAIFRMARQGWTPDQALAEMERFKFHGLWYRQMKGYVQRFPAKLKATPALGGEPQPATTH